MAFHLEDQLDPRQDRISLLSVRPAYYRVVTFSSLVFFVFVFASYWVLGVSWFLLYCFVSDHSLEKCNMLYRVRLTDFHHNDSLFII
jgi:hypothetical protein